MDLNKKEQAFANLIDRCAERRGCVFFWDTESGKEIETETMTGWDMFGWLIPKHRAEEFRPLWKSDNTDGWEEFMVNEEVSLVDGTIEVGFRKIPPV